MRHDTISGFGIIFAAAQGKSYYNQKLTKAKQRIPDRHIPEADLT